jgi:FkbM family methyltransferase
MNLILARLRDKPHYVFHPTRAFRRALRGVAPNAYADRGMVVAHLPWGLPLQVSLSDAIGYSILVGGVFDPCVTETFHRLIDPGDLVVDVGANIGYLTSMAAVRAGAGGAVIAYEPHPRVFEMLAQNVSLWDPRPDLAPVEIHQTAMSDRAGTGALAAGPLFDANMGLAVLHTEATPSTADADLHDVTVQQLDEVIADRPVGLLKIDVEGHEPQVLRGARGLLERGQIRDIIFEDHEEYPDEATELVEGAGYTLLSLENDLLGLRVRAPRERGATARWPGPSYLATRDPARAQARLAPRGWRVAGIGPTLPWRSGRRRSG